MPIFSADFENEDEETIWNGTITKHSAQLTQFSSGWSLSAMIGPSWPFSSADKCT